MKIAAALLVVLIVAALPAKAQTRISNEMANTYFANCMKGEADNLTAQTKETMCACTAAQMMLGFSVEDMEAMSRRDEAARLALNKMIVNVYAPCIRYPAFDYYYGVCSADPRSLTLSKNPQAMCHCLANKVSNHLGANSQQIFADILARNPYITDPMAALTSDPAFDRFAQGQLLSCVQ